VLSGGGVWVGGVWDVHTKKSRKTGRLVERAKKQGCRSIQTVNKKATKEGKIKKRGGNVGKGATYFRGEQTTIADREKKRRLPVKYSCQIGKCVIGRKGGGYV